MWPEIHAKRCLSTSFWVEAAPTQKTGWNITSRRRQYHSFNADRDRPRMYVHPFPYRALWFYYLICGVGNELLETNGRLMSFVFTSLNEDKIHQTAVRFRSHHHIALYSRNTDNQIHTDHSGLGQISRKFLKEESLGIADVGLLPYPYMPDNQIYHDIYILKL